jgi:DNA repair protein RecO (recombination protein O)
MKSVETRAFVLRTVDYGDSHVIVTLLGRDLGKFSAMARSARKSKKRFGGSLLPLRGLTATVTFRPNRDLANLDRATVAHDYPGIEATYEKITIASYATELVRNALRDGDEANDMFDLLHGFYESLGSADDDVDVLRAVLYHFELSLMRVSGSAPSLRACHRCGKPWESLRKLRCLRDGHGLVCGNCVRRGERFGVLEADTLTALHYLEAPEGRPPDALADREIGAQIRRVLDASLEHVVDYEMRSRAMLDTVLE